MTATDRRILVVGAGAVGGWIAARLALAGNDLSVLARGNTLAAIRGGLRLTDGGTTQIASVNATDTVADLGQPDLLIIAVKAPALPALAPAIAPLIGEGTTVVPMLNGVPWWFLGDDALTSVDPDSAIVDALPMQHIVGCVVHAAVSRGAPGHVVVKHADRLILGEPFGGASERVERLVQLFEGSGIRAEAAGDVRRAIWYKLWGNATINPLSALTRATADKLLDDPVLRAFMSQAMDELAGVGRAIGCPIEESSEDRMAVTARLGTFKPSMLQDVEAGRAIELVALVGAPIEIARCKGIPTPALDRIYAMTRLMSEGLSLR